MKIVKSVFLGLVAVTIVASLGLVLWAGSPLQAEPEALSALESDANVRVINDAYITFQPIHSEPTTALVFYPGGRVDYRAYAAPLHRIAEEGILVFLLPVRLNLAMLDSNAADQVISAYPSIKHWAVGGHSLGGTAAALYASQHAVDGLVLWASYPGDDALNESAIDVLSIYGTQDVRVDTIEASRGLLPADAQYVVISGGNHSQFGDYGLQPGDNAASITRADQQGQAVDATVQFLKEISQ